MYLMRRKLQNTIISLPIGSIMLLLISLPQVRCKCLLLQESKMPLSISIQRVSVLSLMTVASCLLDHDVDLIAIVHLKSLRCVIVLDSLAVEDESTLIAGQSLPLTVGFHELLELRRLFDLEEDL